MNKKISYYKFEDIDTTYLPFAKRELAEDLEELLEEESLSNYIFPSDLATHKAIYDELYSLVLARYREHAIGRIISCINEEVSEADKQKLLKDFYYRFMNLLNVSHTFYIIMLNNYKNAETHLMDDIKATSSNKVSFNDTPQNSNESGTYEGDNYITHFTKTSGENSSPLMSKIMRLKEIQDNYRDYMSNWVNEFERIYLVEEC